MEQVLSSTLGAAQISDIIFGTMRLAHQSPNTNISLLRYLYQHGVNTHHISSEYGSYEAYCVLHQQLKDEGMQIKHAVKIGSPDFKQESFNPLYLEERIDQELLKLGVEQLTIVQWMFRMEQLDDTLRIAVTTQQADDIEGTFSMLRQKGKVVEFGHFPYSNTYAQHVRTLGLTAATINYLNIYEYSNVTFGEVEPFIALRPFAAGKIREVLNNPSLLEALQQACNLNSSEIKAAILFFPFLYPNVKAVVCSLNTKNQVDEALQNYHKIKKIKTNCFHIVNTIIKMTNFV